MARAYRAGGFCWRADFLVVIMCGFWNVALVNLIVAGVFGGCRVRGDTTLGCCTLVGITVAWDVLIGVSGVVVAVVGTLGSCVLVCLVRKDVIVGCCLFGCGACSNAFHRDHNCCRMFRLFSSVGGCFASSCIALLRSCILALSVSSVVGSSNLMLLCGSHIS